jgi:hypothetical protein
MCWPTRTTSRNVEKTASGSRPVDGGRRPSAGMTDDAGGRRGDHSTGTSGRIPLSDSHLLGHRAVHGSVTHNLRGPSHTPNGHKEAHRRAYALANRSGAVTGGRGPGRRRQRRGGREQEVREAPLRAGRTCRERRGRPGGTGRREVPGVRRLAVPGSADGSRPAAPAAHLPPAVREHPAAPRQGSLAWPGPLLRFLERGPWAMAARATSAVHEGRARPARPRGAR